MLKHDALFPLRQFQEVKVEELEISFNLIRRLERGRHETYCILVLSNSGNNTGLQAARSIHTYMLGWFTTKHIFFFLPWKMWF
jgi:hypothetical protein